MQAGDLGGRVHHRRPGRVLHRLADEHGTHLPPQLANLRVVGRHRLDHRQVELGRQVQTLVVAEPGLEGEVALGLEVGCCPVQPHHFGQCRRDVGDVGHDRPLGRADGAARGEQAVHPEHLHEPALLGRRVVARAGHGAGVADGPGQLGLPAADDAGDDRLGRPELLLVIAAGLGIEDRGLGPVVVAQRVDELRGGEMDIDVLARGDRGRGPPAGSGEVLCYRRGEVARVGEDRDRALEQGLAWIVAAERTTDPHPVPGIRDAQPIGAEDVDPVGLADGADLARVVDRDLLGDDDDLRELGVDPDQLGHTVAHRRGGQVDDAGVEAVAGGQALAHRVEDRHVAQGRLELLAAPARRGAEGDIAAGEGVADRRHVAGFAAQDVEHADPVLARGDLRQGRDADEVLEPRNTLLVHVYPPSIRRGLFRLPCAGRDAGPLEHARRPSSSDRRLARS